jgi:hypothetical protein
MTTKKKIVLAVVAVLAIPVVWYGYWGLKLYIGARKEGFLDAPVKREYTGDSVANLKAIHTALLLYQDSEGALPVASGWMDAAWSRLQTADMDEDEAKKKLKSDGITSAEQFGYAFNDAASGKYSKDLPDSTILVYDSTNLNWNAHGKPTPPKTPRPKGSKAITVGGKIIDLK